MLVRCFRPSVVISDGTTTEHNPGVLMATPRAPHLQHAQAMGDKTVHARIAAKTVHGGDAFAGLTFTHPTQGKAPDAKRVRPCRVLLWEAWKRLTRWCPSRSRKEPLRRPLADVSLNHSRRKEEDNPSRDSTTKKGNAFPFIALEDGTPMPHNEVLKLGLVRFKGTPARRRLETWTVHGGDTFASLSRRPQHKAKRLGDRS